MAKQTEEIQCPSELESELSLLEERAQQIRNALKNGSGVDAMTADVEVLQCDMSGVTVGVETKWIQKVIMLPALQPIPQREDWLLGMLNYGGEQIPVIHTAKRVLQSFVKITEDFSVVVCRSRERAVGLLMASTSGVCSGKCHWFPQIDESLPVSDYVTGMITHSDGESIYLLSIDRIIRGLKG